MKTQKTRITKAINSLYQRTLDRITIPNFTLYVLQNYHHKNSKILIQKTDMLINETELKIQT